MNQKFKSQYNPFLYIFRFFQEIKREPKKMKESSQKFYQKIIYKFSAGGVEALQIKSFSMTCGTDKFLPD